MVSSIYVEVNCYKLTMLVYYGLGEIRLKSLSNNLCKLLAKLKFYLLD